MKPRKIRKLLVANRGEIALRVMRTARALGIATVAVYSDADRAAAHVGAADEAIAIGPSEPSQSYLNIAAIITAARAAGADAIHPGYGFLSERPEFARAAAENDLLFIGPPPEVMAALGDKVAARRIAVKAGAPVVPGVETGDLASARKFAERAGFPILVKAAAGGGGRGMRVVAEAGALETALEAASREAQAAFGDGRVFLEKYLARPRHVEIQLIADRHGEVVALGERDCSIQRRHQKVIEESPAPGLSSAMRARIVAAALNLARVAGYQNAGTAEFLLEGEEFYFLEVNARLQVEHPVTELRFGRDLVAEQLRIAEGDRVCAPDEPRGAAIECRINAEDPEYDFRPATGRVIALTLPSGPGVRVDTHLGPGAEISPYYDSLAAKLVAYGADRETARTRMIAAFDEFALLGPRTNAAFLRDIIASEGFARADLSTRFLEEHLPRWRPDEHIARAALIAAALAADGRIGSAAGGGFAGANGAKASSRPSPWTALAGFEAWGRR